VSGLLAFGFLKTEECSYLLRKATGLELPLKPDVGPLTNTRSSEYSSVLLTIQRIGATEAVRPERPDRGRQDKHR